MRFIASLATSLRFASMALLIIGGTAAYGADSYSAGRLTITTLVMGNMTLSNVVVGVGSIVSGPAGTGPIGTVDTYNPANGQVTVQAVTVGANTLYNAVLKVSSLISVGSVTGADTYDGSLVHAPIIASGGNTLSYATFTPTGAATIGNGMPTALYDSFDGTNADIPVVTYAGHVFTNVRVPASQPLLGTTDQTVTFSEPVSSPTPLAIGASEAILASATSGLPISYVVQTPSICTVVRANAQQGYGYINYSAPDGSGTGVIGAAPLGSGAYQANWFFGTTGTTGTGAPLGLAIASPALNPYPSSAPGYVPPYPNFHLGSGNWVFDNVLLVNGGPLLDLGGVALTTAGDPVINLYFQTPFYYYFDDNLFNTTGLIEPMNLSARIVNGLVGLSNGACVVTAFQPGDNTFKAATPASIRVEVGVTVLP